MNVVITCAVKIHQLISIVTIEMMTVVHIGIDLKMDSIYAEALTQLLMQKTKHMRGHSGGKIRF